MFYCDDCRVKYAYPESTVKSSGPCECCGGVRVCNDVPSSQLPPPKPPPCLVGKFAPKDDGERKT